MATSKSMNNLVERAERFAGEAIIKTDQNKRWLASYRKTVADIKQRVQSGESTGHRNLDLAIVFCDSLNPQIQGYFGGVEWQLANHKEQFILIVTRKENYHHVGLLPPTLNDHYLETIWDLGIINGSELVADFRNCALAYPTHMHASRVHYEQVIKEDGNIKTGILSSPRFLNTTIQFENPGNARRELWQPPLEMLTIVCGNEEVRQFFYRESTPYGKYALETYNQLTTALGCPDEIPQMTYGEASRLIAKLVGAAVR